METNPGTANFGRGPCFRRVTSNSGRHGLGQRGYATTIPSLRPLFHHDAGYSLLLQSIGKQGGAEMRKNGCQKKHRDGRWLRLTPLQLRPEVTQHMALKLGAQGACVRLPALHPTNALRRFDSVRAPPERTPAVDLVGQ